MFCHNCGNQLPNGTKFCDKCGTKLSEDTTTSNHPQYKPNPFAEPGQNIDFPQPYLTPNPFAEPGQKIDIYGQIEYSTSDPNVAAILSLLFGVLGFHDFYCGNTKNGLIKLILSLTGIASIVSIIWNIIDLYNIGDGSYTDGEGRNLSAAPWAKVIVLLELVLSIGLGLLVFMLLGSLL
jgi:TM2 domain-containing membrane protein YozV